MLALVLGLLTTGSAGAAQRSLASIISESFDRQDGQTAAAGATSQEMVQTVTVTPTPGPMPMHAVETGATPTMAPMPAPVQAVEPGATPTPGFEHEVGAAMRSLNESVRHTVDRFHQIVISPNRLQPVPAADPTMSCNALYAETSRLVGLGERYRPSYSEDPRNITIGAAGFVFTPAFYLYGVTAYAAWYENGHRKDAKQRVAELRRLMADRRCFSRD